MSWEKHGSPYDPNYKGSGKIQRPQSRAEQDRREQERHQLRGCGDPTCSMCNPVTAAMATSRGSRSFFAPPATGVSFAAIDDVPKPNGTFTASDRYTRLSDEMKRAIQKSYYDMLGINFDSASPPPPSTPQPSADYRSAREKVKDWIVPAPDQAFEDIVGNEAALEQLRDAIQAPVAYKDLYKAYGMRMPKGAMLSGPPGCGKTMFARAAAAEMRRLYGEAVEFVSISGAELQSMYVGETEARIKAIFTFAREYRAFHGHPLLVFLDEAEVLLPDRTGRVRRVAPWEESQVATFLAEMDGMQESGAFVLLATNRPEVIDQAVLRDGRCDFKIVVQRPTPEATEQILRKCFAGIKVADGVSIDDLVFAAAECLRDPNRILLEASLISINLGEGRVDASPRHFLLEHIVSGAIAASIPERAKRQAFARDKADGVARGVTVDDVVAAVNDVFQENRGLDHAFARGEFEREVMREARAAREASAS